VPAAAADARGQIQGAALVRRNVPVVGAVVTVRRSDDVSDLRLTTTDVRGAFRFDGLPDGRYRCEVAHDGYATVVKEDVDLRAPFRAVVEVTMAPAAAGVAPPPAPAIVSADVIAPDAGAAALRGAVRDAQGKGTGEVRLRLTREDGSDDPREQVTAGDGSFAFAGLRPGRWRLEVQGAGLLPVRTTVALAGTTSLAVSLVPQPAGHLPSVDDLMPREEPVPPR
jgi:hypothetical protein